MINWLKKIFGIKPKPTWQEVVAKSNQKITYPAKARNGVATRATYSDSSGNSTSYDLADLSGISTSGYSHVSESSSSNDSFDYGGGSFGGGGSGSDWGSSDSSSSYDSGSSDSSSSSDW